MKLLNKRPYYLRMMRDWITDCGGTPMIMVDLEHWEPPGMVKLKPDQKSIVLNISHDATTRFSISYSYIGFDARFNGENARCDIPCNAVSAIFMRENGHALKFAATSGPDNDPREPEPEKKPDRSHLRVVK